MKVIWKDICDNYKVSNTGQVYSKLSNKILKPQKHTEGYLKVLLSGLKGQKNFFVHRLVAMAFVENAENKHCVNHKNGCKEDNRADNLEWVSYSENQKHSVRTLGNKPYKFPLYLGKNHWESKKICQIKNNKVIAEFYGCGEASRKTGIHENSIRNVIHNRAKTAGGFVWRLKGVENV